MIAKSSKSKKWSGFDPALAVEVDALPSSAYLRPRRPKRIAAPINRRRPVHRLNNQQGQLRSMALSKFKRARILWPLVLILTPFETLSAQATVAPSPSGPSDEVRGAPYKLTIDGAFPILFSGYIQVRYTDAPATANPFQVKRLRFAADALLTDKIDLFVQIDPTLSPNPLLDAYIQFKPRREARIRAGQFKVPFSGESLVADERMIPIERSIVVNSFSPGRDSGQQGRDLGVMFLGNAGGETGPTIEYSAAFLNGSGIYNAQSNRQKAGAGRFILHPFTGASIGGDYYQGKEPLPGAPATSSQIVAKQRQELEGGYKTGHFVSWAEYLWGHDGSIDRSGGYGLAAYRFTSRWESFARAQQYNSYHGRRGSITRLYEAGANYYITRLVRLQADYGVEKMPKNGALAQVALAQIQAEF